MRSSSKTLSPIMGLPRIFLTVTWIGGLLFLLFMNTACSPSGSPRSEELIKTAVPTFSGQRQISLTTPSTLFSLNGECDPKSYGLEYSYDDGSTWNTHAPGCTNGSFSISVFVPKVRTFLVRSRTKLGFTESGVATVRLVLPPTDPAFQVVNAGSSIDEGDLGIAMTMSGTFGGRSDTNGTHNIDYHITGIVYGTP